MIAALYVQKDGAYFGLPDVDPWDEKRDARMYDGPGPVVAHPPCARWSQTAALTEAWFRYKRGDDYGLPTKKPTWIYAYGVSELPDLRWGFSSPDPEGKIDPNGRGGMHAFRNAVSKTASSRTPFEFRDVLLSIARSAQPSLDILPALSRCGLR